ncbi:MAG: glycosyltransferase family 2 protein [Promethearchaeota archaeon]|nr:MAG: glycosyltransferase family 2 protein [Candidatus Lokiarchaeota archaeon]
MGRIRYFIYGTIIVALFAFIHYIFPPEWSRWIQNTNALFSGTNIQHLGLFILGSFFFVVFVLLYGINFLASFGRVAYPEGSEHFTPPLSVIIPAKNEERVIGNTLESFSNSAYPKDILELIVVASGSTDKTVEICHEYKTRHTSLDIKIVTEDLPKKGKPAALNHGLKYATHDLICIYDADTLIRADTLQSLVRHLYNPEIAATSGPVVVRNWDTNILTKGIALEYTYVSGTGLYHAVRDHLGRSLWLMGRNYCIRKAILEQFGGWNEDALTEDLHLSAQLSAAKKKVKYAPHAFISENVPTTFKAFRHQRRRWVGGYKQGLDAAMELDKRTVILRNLAMMHHGNCLDFSLGAILTAIIFGIAGEFFVMIVCLTIFIFPFGTYVNAVRKFADGRYRLLLYYFVTIFIDINMFITQFKSIEKLEWEKTALD